VTALEQEMLSRHVEGQALKFLVRMTRARRVLELGMFTGYSALAMAEALPEGGRVLACELDPDVAAFAQRCFDKSPAGAKIEVRVGRAQATLEQLAADREAFDFVFVDADKAGYLEHVMTVLDRRLLAARRRHLRRQHAAPGRALPSGRAVRQRRGDRRLQRSHRP
jgi:caffeoyl-CoA O-methyltransferase